MVENGIVWVRECAPSGSVSSAGRQENSICGL